jgi:5-methylcytosine-specific restriction enzyme B
MDNQLLYKIKEDFLKEWPINRLESMSLEEYTNLDKTSFCYWVESLTTELGSIWGGSAFKFGVFRRDNLDKGDYEKSGRTAKGNYSWYSKYGNDKDVAYETVKSYIVQIAKFSQKGNLKDIESIDLGYAYKWKIAFLYGDYNIINLFKHNAILICAKYLGYDGEDKSHTALNDFILNKKEDKDFYDFAKELWAVFDNVNPIKAEFEKWLKSKNELESGKVSSYLRAIDILRNEFKVQIYEEDEIEILEDLYEDLKQHQKERNGKYFYIGAKSYGEGGFYSAAVGAYIEFLKTKNGEAIININNLINMDNVNELNQIFFGPPGTGKTYNTINDAIKIADPEFYKANHDNRDELKKRFKLLLLNNDNENVGQIGFTTFHQSMSYEDFIEGIKPVQPIATDTYLKYEIQEGIFKRICRIANDSINAVDVKPDSLLSLSQDEFDKAHFYKMSLGNSQSDLDNEIYDYCIQNNCIALGWGDGYDYTGKDEKSIKEFAIEKGVERFSVTAINQFKILLKVCDYVIISNGNYYVRAIGKVVGEYEFREESPFANNPTYNQFRNVEWIFTDKSIPATEIYNKNLSQQTIYQLIKNEIKQEFFVKDKKVDLVKLPKNPKNYVLIIDEINRGNVSSIFGELITLIEKDKRAGKDEELSVVLPYSKNEFKVPHNVFIIGTMNTADRSIEALDTALRRRFSFREMPPKPELILLEGKLKDKNGKIDDIDVVQILKVMNDRIEKLIDKDHKIGHSYFLGIETLDDLKQTFKDKVIPLLEEYFFGDFGKISLVLGSSFISKSNKSGVSFAKNNEYDTSVANDLLERGVYEITTTDNWDFKAIYQ